jgi:hypothetical protein
MSSGSADVGERGRSREVTGMPYEELTTLYFDRPGKSNLDDTLVAALRRAKTLGIGHVVVASTTGRTGLRTMELARELSYDGQIIVVTNHAGFKEPGVQLMPAEAVASLKESGAVVHTATHALSSAARSFRLKYGGIDMLETIAETLRLFGQGMKVCVELALMTADAGLVPVDRDIVTVGGSGGGADAAVVVRAANQNRLFDLKIREVIAMVRG